MRQCILAARNSLHLLSNAAAIPLREECMRKSSLRSLLVVSVVALGLAISAPAAEKAAHKAHAKSASAQGDAGTSLKYRFPNYQPDRNPMLIQGPAGEIFKFTKTGATTCGKYTIADATIPP